LQISPSTTERSRTPPHGMCVCVAVFGSSHIHAWSYCGSPDVWVWVCEGLVGGTPAAAAARVAAVVFKRMAVGGLANCLAAVLLQGESIGSPSLPCRAEGSGKCQLAKEQGDG